MNIEIFVGLHIKQVEWKTLKKPSINIIDNRNIEFIIDQEHVFTPCYGTGGYLKTVIIDRGEFYTYLCKYDDRHVWFLKLNDNNTTTYITVLKGDIGTIKKLVAAEIAHFN